MWKEGREEGSGEKASLFPLAAPLGLALSSGVSRLHEHHCLGEDGASVLAMSSLPSPFYRLWEL